MKRLLLSLAILIFLVVYALSDGSSYSGLVMGFLLLPVIVVVQLIVMKLLFPRKTNVEEIE